MPNSQINNWVRCCDRLPTVKRSKDASKPYIIEYVSRSSANHMVTTGIWTGKKWIAQQKKLWDAPSHRVVAWMELPEPSYTPVWDNVK